MLKPFDCGWATGFVISLMAFSISVNLLSQELVIFSIIAFIYTIVIFIASVGGMWEWIRFRNKFDN